MKRHFFLACLGRKIDAVKVLLNNDGVNINVCDFSGRTPIFIAVLHNNLDIIKWMIASGRDIDLASRERYTPIEIAEMLGYNEIAELLTDWHADELNVDRHLKFETSDRIREELARAGTPFSKRITLTDFVSRCLQSGRDFGTLTTSKDFGFWVYEGDKKRYLNLEILIENQPSLFLKLKHTNYGFDIELSFAENDEIAGDSRSSVDIMCGERNTLYRVYYSKTRPEDYPNNAPMSTGTSACETIFSIAYLLGRETITRTDVATIKDQSEIPLTFVRLMAGRNFYGYEDGFRPVAKGRLILDEAKEKIKRLQSLLPSLVGLCKDITEYGATTERSDRLSEKIDNLSPNFRPYVDSVFSDLERIEYSVTITRGRAMRWVEEWTNPEDVAGRSAAIQAEVCFLCAGFLVVKGRIDKDDPRARFFGMMNSMKKTELTGGVSGQPITPIISNYVNGVRKDIIDPAIGEQKLNQLAGRFRDLGL